MKGDYNCGVDMYGGYIQASGSPTINSGPIQLFLSNEPIIINGTLNISEFSVAVGNFNYRNRGLFDLSKLSELETTDDTPTKMVFIGHSSFWPNLGVPSFKAVGFIAYVTAKRTNGANEGAFFKLEGAIRRETLNSSTSLIGTVTKTAYKDDSNWDVDATANTTNGRLEITVTGATGKTIKWTAKVEFIEAPFAIA
jgi:hypothetical protein